MDAQEEQALQYVGNFKSLSCAASLLANNNMPQLSHRKTKRVVLVGFNVDFEPHNMQRTNRLQPVPKLMI